VRDRTDEPRKTSSLQRPAAEMPATRSHGSQSDPGAPPDTSAEKERRSPESPRGRSGQPIWVAFLDLTEEFIARAGKERGRSAPPIETQNHRVVAEESRVLERSGANVSLSTTAASPTEAMNASGRVSDLRTLAVRGGSYLLGREAIGGGVRLLGLVLVVKLIGPADYGIYSAALAFVLWVVTLAQMGAETYLIRQPGEIEQIRYHYAFTFLLGTSLVATGVAESLTFALAPLLRPTGVILPLRVLLLSIPINVLWAPAQAAIERAFRYRVMGLIELGGDVALYGTAVPLAFLKFGTWSLVIGCFSWQAWLLVTSTLLAGLRPRLKWSRAEGRELLRHGASYASARWIGQASSLVNPMVVGAFYGAAGVGFVSFAQRLIDSLGFAQHGAPRLGLVAMSKVSLDEPERLRSAIEWGSKLQLLAMVIPFAAFGGLAPWVVPALFGHQWSRAIPVYVILALATVVTTSSAIQNAFLLSKGRNGAVARTMFFRLTFLIAAAVPLVRWFGLNGYAFAVLISALALSLSSHLQVRRLVTVRYHGYLAWALVLAPTLLIPVIPMPWAPLCLLSLGFLATRRMKDEVRTLRDLLGSSLLGHARIRQTAPTVQVAQE
jgi:O-antigen/teichoic acid export membrane protein